ncbi:MAG: transposase [Pseudomonadales bacterium]
MPRKARVLVPNCPHHVVQRGHNRKAVFLAEEDYQFYLNNLQEWKTALGIKLYAWCLMTNHIHLVVEPGKDAKDLSTLMKRVNGRQAAYVNKLEGRSGALWEGRYKASPIQKEAYLLACCRYVELNPVKAGMVLKAADYLWSSYQERIFGQGRKLLNAADQYLELGVTAEERKRRYIEFLESGITSAEQRFIQESVSRNQLTGNARFIDEIEMRTGMRVEQRGRGRPRKDEK